MAGDGLWNMLTAEERRFLRELFRESAAREADAEPRRQLAIEADDGQDELVRRVLESGRARLLLDGDGEAMQYTLNVDPASLGGETVRLRARYPVLIDRRGRARSLRVRPKQGEVRIRDHSGRLRQPDVVDISTTGVYLSDATAGGLSSGVHFSVLDLRLPNRESVRVGGRVVRVGRVGAQVGLAVEFDRSDLDAESRSALRRYVYERHSYRPS
ncbi:hypothetical protein HC341_03360 [Aquisalimonas sp. 2447]|uniref:PilZ domain-containing protein n=1 Tax=Aquisalimonas sp. 2447 TaxID=2740807 RepID=UPI00143251EE|nr:PilZ domain-containing protein [Aquisalimonas sp. 2447]QIT54341.1 hypothetical protein HC341_03360 [Aquisalimonas sp. 2447]